MHQKWSLWILLVAWITRRRVHVSKLTITGVESWGSRYEVLTSSLKLGTRCSKVLYTPWNHEVFCPSISSSICSFCSKTLFINLPAQLLPEVLPRVLAGANTCARLIFNLCHEYQAEFKLLNTTLAYSCCCCCCCCCCFKSIIVVVLKSIILVYRRQKT